MTRGTPDPSACTKPRQQNHEKKDKADQSHDGATPRPAFLFDSVTKEDTHLDAGNPKKQQLPFLYPSFIARNSQMNGMKATIFRNGACDQSMVSA